jgi:choline-glycine betaine transporter
MVCGGLEATVTATTNIINTQAAVLVMVAALAAVIFTIFYYSYQRMSLQTMSARPTFNVLVFTSLLITAPVTITDYYGAAEDSLARRHSCCQPKRTAASSLLTRQRCF